MASPEGLWWPPFQALHDAVGILVEDAESVSLEDLESTAAEYEGWIARGVQGFRRPQPSSRQVVQHQTSIPCPGGNSSLAVQPSLRPAALEISHILVRPLRIWVHEGWLKESEPHVVPLAGSGMGGEGGSRGVWVPGCAWASA